MEIWHMNGAGNDFLVMAHDGHVPDLSDTAKRLCARYGADGLMAIGTSEKADFRLHFYNSDGSRGEMCGNGSRCVCRFAYDHGYVGERMCVETDAGMVYGRRLTESEYLVHLNPPSVLQLHRKENAAYVELGDPGLPHAVVEIPGLTWEQRDGLRAQAKALRYDRDFPKGANVNFYTWLDEGRIRILSYERGVENYTLACGTGSGATAAVLWAQGKLPTGQLTVENPGGTLTLTVGGTDGRVTELSLRGPTEITEMFELDLTP